MKSIALVTLSAKSRNAGFTLIELMIVVIIIAVLAAIGYPSYQSYSRQGKRAEAKTALSDLAARQEKYFFQCNSCSSNLGGSLSVACTAATTGLGLTAGSPIATMRTPGSNYSVAVTLGGAGNTTYTATATAIGAQASDADCTTFTLTNTGAKGATGARAATCWSK